MTLDPASIRDRRLIKKCDFRPGVYSRPALIQDPASIQSFTVHRLQNLEDVYFSLASGVITYLCCIGALSV